MRIALGQGTRHRPGLYPEAAARAFKAADKRAVEATVAAIAVGTRSFGTYGAAEEQAVRYRGRPGSIQSDDGVRQRWRGHLGPRDAPAIGRQPMTGQAPCQSEAQETPRLDCCRNVDRTT